MIDRRLTWKRTPGPLARLVIVVAALGLALVMPAAGAVRAQAPDWEQLGPGEPVLQLFTPASGAFFARTAKALLRSDDAGATWQPVNLPPAVPPNLPPPVAPPESVPRTFAVDPTDQSIIFASDLVGLMRSTDGGETWARLTFSADASRSVKYIAVSPTDHQRVYALTLSSQSMSDLGSILKSDDGGTTWTVARTISAGPGCAYSFRLFQVHPSDPNQLLRVGGCFRGAPNGIPLERSLDAGVTWKDASTREMGNVQSLVGGHGTLPGRFYLGAIDPSQQQARLFRSDDLGTWTPVLEAPDATSIAVTYDPAAPDKVYVGTSRGVMASADAGQSWQPLGQQALGEIHDLALGIDGANLYAASDQGVWRYRLAAGAP